MDTILLKSNLGIVAVATPSIPARPTYELLLVILLKLLVTPLTPVPKVLNVPGGKELAI